MRSVSEGPALVRVELKEDGYLHRHYRREQETYVGVVEQPETRQRVLRGQEPEDRRVVKQEQGELIDQIADRAYDEELGKGSGQIQTADGSCRPFPKALISLAG